MKLHFKSNLPQALHRLRAAKAGVLAAGSGVLLEGARQRCPVDTGRLRASGGISGNENEARIHFSAAYALYVHERSGNKFLENSANDPAIHKRMLNAMQAAGEF